MNMQQQAYVTSRGTVAYWVSRAAGSRKPWLVFLPGLSADHHLFDKQLEHFTGAYNCLVWDAPAHGLSRPFELTFSMQDMVQDLHGILVQEQIDAPVLIGQSLGGYIAQVYMHLYPGSVQAFVSIDSCSLSRKYYTGWELALLRHTRGMYRAIPWKLLLRWGITGNATTDYGRRLMEATWAVYTRDEFCDLAGHGFRILAQAIEAQPAYPISCPVLLLCGEKDAAGSAKRYNRRWAELDGYPVHWIKDAGHNSNADAPEVVNRLIEDFLKTLEPSPSAQA